MTIHEDPLLTPVQYVSGVGERRAEMFARLGVFTVEDLLWMLPRDVLDLTIVCPVDQLEKDVLQTVRGEVVDIDVRTLSGGRSMVAVLLDCNGHYLRGSWFNQHWMRNKFTIGEFVLFSGKPKRRSGRWEIGHPQVQWLEEDDPTAHGGVLPRYRLTEGLKMQAVRHIAQHAVNEYVSLVADPLPESFREEQKLPGLQSAIRFLHTPKTMQEYQQGRDRLIYDDLLEFQLGLAIRRRAWKRGGVAPQLPVTAKIDARIRRLFPFKLTAGQDDAIQDICHDFSLGVAMHRLLQADVGAGKTVIAIYAMLVAIAAGYQVVLMAPTEVLATQHWATIDDALQQSRVGRLLLTGRLTPAERARALNAIAENNVQLIVGTQAVIQKDVQFANLGLAVIDEQHKFGVAQRGHFSKGDQQPHVLVMTATPIPRSLSLTQFGDLDISTMTELPPGRQQI
ncbi:ATP-dependent DNA helicase RecG, partial [hydrothermal vent metagenome]